MHCYQWFAGDDWREISEDISLYFLTDWLVRSWETAVIKGLGLDRFPWLRETYFEHITKVVFLRQDPDRTAPSNARPARSPRTCRRRSRSEAPASLHSRRCFGR